jgi:hypothetical protein
MSLLPSPWAGASLSSFLQRWDMQHPPSPVGIPTVLLRPWPPRRESLQSVIYLANVCPVSAVVWAPFPLHRGLEVCRSVERQGQNFRQ